MNLINFYRKNRPPRSPFPGLVDHHTYRSLIKTAPFECGSTILFDREMQFSDYIGYLHSLREIFIDEVYKFNSKTDSPHIIDAGANIGLSIIYFKRLYPNSTIVAYEPDPLIFNLLRANTSHYADVSIHQAAVWIDNVDLTFYSEGSLAGSTDIDFLRKGVARKVEAVRLLDELKKRPVDFLKIDIEGAENSVLFDIKDELDNVSLLFFEYHSNPDKTQMLGEILNLVSEKGFRYIINGAHGPRLPFVEKVSHGFDLQLNVFCFRD